MKPHSHKALGTLLASLLLSTGASATELVYTPVNPSFGGSPLNGAWLLGNAQAQNSNVRKRRVMASSHPDRAALICWVDRHGVERRTDGAHPFHHRRTCCPGHNDCRRTAS